MVNLDSIIYTPFSAGTASDPIRVPSVATLSSIPWLGKLHNDPEKVTKAARDFMRAAALDPANYKRDGFTLTAAEIVLDALNKMFETHGVERASLHRNGPTRFLYLNTGDTYTTTIVFFGPTRSWRVTSWGDVVEAEERKGIKYE